MNTTPGKDTTMTTDTLQATARDRATSLILGCLSKNEPAIHDVLRELANDPDHRATPLTVVVLASMSARMAHALAEDDPRRTETMLETAISEEIDAHAPRGEA